MSHHVMLDLETLGTKPGCPILSIGAATFNCGVPELFGVNVKSEQPLMDAPDPATASWWEKQAEEAKAEVFNNPYAEDLFTSLTVFNEWLLKLKNDPADRIILWGNGATFDEPIILEAMKRYGINPVWTFRDAMCFRTLKALGKMLGVAEPEFTGVKHNSLHDAAHQAKWADKIFAKLGPAA